LIVAYWVIVNVLMGANFLVIVAIIRDEGVCEGIQLIVKKL